MLPTEGAETGLKRETENEPNLGNLAFKAKVSCQTEIPFSASAQRET